MPWTDQRCLELSRQNATVRPNPMTRQFSEGTYWGFLGALLSDSSTLDFSPLLRIAPPVDLEGGALHVVVAGPDAEVLNGLTSLLAENRAKK